MVYETYFSGDIEINDKKALALIKYLIEHNKPPLDGWKDVLSVGTNGIEICDDIKNRGEFIEKLCLIIATMDKTATGNLDAEGEERDDNWIITIRDGMVFISLSKIVYDKETGFQDKETSESGQRILADDNLWTEVIADKI